MIKLAFVKFISISIGAATGILQIAFFSRYLDESNFAFMLFLFGLASFSSFFDIVTRPAYGILREDFTRGLPWQSNMVSMVRFCTLQSVMFGVTFGCVIVILASSSMQQTISKIVLVVLVVSVSLTVFFSGLRIIASALGNYSRAEYLEALRRILWLCAIVAVMFDTSLGVTAWAMTIVVFVTTGILLRMLSVISGHSVKSLLRWELDDLRTTLTRVGRPGANSLLVLACETFTFNAGYLVSSSFGGASALIQFGIWQKLLMAGIMLAQIGPDILVHRITASYFNNEVQAARSEFVKSLCLGLLSVALFYLLLLTLEEWIFNLWLEGKYRLNNVELIALGVWLGGAAVQHSSGLILTYTGRSFQEMSIRSAMVAASVLLIAVPLFWLTHNLGIFLLGGAVIYTIGAGTYFVRCYRFLSSSALS